IRVAAVIDEFGAASGHGSINDPAAVQDEKIKASAFAGTDDFTESLIGLAVGDALAGVRDHFAARRYVFVRKHAPAVNPGTGNAEQESGAAGTECGGGSYALSHRSRFGSSTRACAF